MCFWISISGWNQTDLPDHCFFPWHTCGGHPVVTQVLTMPGLPRFPQKHPRMPENPRKYLLPGFATHALATRVADTPCVPYPLPFGSLRCQVHCNLYIVHCTFTIVCLPPPLFPLKEKIFEFSPVFYLSASKSRFTAFDLISFRSTQLCIQCAPIRNLCAFDRSDLPRLVKHPMCICTNCVCSKSVHAVCRAVNWF